MVTWLWGDLSHLWFWPTDICVQVTGWIRSFCGVMTGAICLSWGRVDSPWFSGGCYYLNLRTVQWEYLFSFVCVGVCTCSHVPMYARVEAKAQVLLSRAALFDKDFWQDFSLESRACHWGRLSGQQAPERHLSAFPGLELRVHTTHLGFYA